jgi:hypothetical protein
LLWLLRNKYTALYILFIPMPHKTSHDFQSQGFEINDKNKTLIFAENSPFSWWLSAGQDRLPPEVERDNVEYKVNNSLCVSIIHPSTETTLVETNRNVRGKTSSSSDTNEMESRRIGILLVHYRVNSDNVRTRTKIA